ncbi:hypothetical protein DFJ73DRAFT_822828 [Zopfochytrium polystomum]|nr:hypothetical protein DFJ73DRAFT_822828 [Zopfochytrium polystomum]
MSSPKPATAEVLIDLPDDCVLASLLYLDARQLVACSRLCKKFKRLIEHPSLWRFVEIKGSVVEAIGLIDHALIRRAPLIRILSVENVTFLEGIIPGESEAATDLRQHFLSSFDGLMKRVGPKLEELHISDSLDDESAEHTLKRARTPIVGSSSLSVAATTSSSSSGLFTEAQSLLGSVAEYCKNIKRLSLEGSEEADTIADSTILMLTKSCPLVEEFRDNEASGISAQALKFMVDGWKELKSLEVNTELTDVSSFAATVALFGSRLKRLSLTHFQDSLSVIPVSNSDSSSTTPPSSRLDLFVRALKELKSLEVLAIDLSNTPHMDGLNPESISLILDACPKLQGLEYFAPIDAYFEDDNNDPFGDVQSIQSGPGGKGDSGSFLRRRVFQAELSSDVHSRAESVETASVTFARPFRENLSVVTREDDEYDEVTSMAPGLPSPNTFSAPLELFGTWYSKDKLSIRKRAAKTLNLEDETGFFTGKYEQFFTLLERVADMCTSRNVTLNLAWSI